MIFIFSSQIYTVVNTTKFYWTLILPVSMLHLVTHTSLSLQVIDLGVFLHPGSYCRNLWNILDATVVICAVVAFFFEYVFTADTFPPFPILQYNLCISKSKKMGFFLPKSLFKRYLVYSITVCIYMQIYSYTMKKIILLKQQFLKESKKKVMFSGVQCDLNI